jgi:hypothetical protein
MSHPAVTELLTSLADVVDVRVPAAEAAGRAARALSAVFEAQPRLVLDVQFTGFFEGGRPATPVSPQVLRVASHLIMRRVTRIGFTPEVAEADLALFLQAVVTPSVELPEEGLLGLIESAQPRGIYLAAVGGQAYRPPRAQQQQKAPDASSEQPEPEAAASPGGFLEADEPETPVGDFDLLDEATTTELAAAASAPHDAAPEPQQTPHGDGGADAGTMFDLFRSSADIDGRSLDAAAVIDGLNTAENPSTFTEYASAAGAIVPRLLRSGDVEQAAAVLVALAQQVQRTDRTRLFRESAAQALRRNDNEATAGALVEWLELSRRNPEALVSLLSQMGPASVDAIEGLFVRTSDASLRRLALTTLLRNLEHGDKVFKRIGNDPGTPTTRLRLVLDTLEPGMAEPAELARWVELGAGHAVPAIRKSAAAAAARVGERFTLRTLINLLTDADRAVRIAAILALGELRDPAAVSFLARLLSETDDEEIQLAVIHALGTIGAPEGVGPLMSVVARRQLFGNRRLNRLKLAAIAALGQTPARSAAEALASIASSRDTDLAAEAKQQLSRR